MPGMSTGLQPSNPTIISAFQSLLLHQGLVVLLILALLAIAWNVLRAMQFRQAVAKKEGTATAVPTSSFSYPEPVARRLLRIGFGLIWIFDGLLQGQASMPLGMTTQVLEPTAAASPPWVQHLVNAGATIWGNHPIVAPVSAVWIQIGIGAWLLVAPRGTWSRLAGLASAGWGLLVWVFGESFGGIFAPGLTWLFGAPGAVLFYSFAGLLIALPERPWASPRLGRSILAVMGCFFIGMAVLQAWPGRGFWQGHLPGSSSPGTLTGMVQQMSQTPQPSFLSSWVASFASFDSAHGFAVNLFAAIALSVIGMAFLTGQARIVRPAVAASIVLCLADWVLIEDLGFLGGVGTDPNSMIPMTLIYLAGYLAMTRLPVAAPALEAATVVPAIESSWRERIAGQPTYVFRALAALGAIGITVLGAAPMAFASLNPNADPILAQAIRGTPQATNFPTPDFHLIDQNGQSVSLASLHGKAVALTFLDPVCVSDCPLIAQEFRAADGLLGADARRIDLVAVVINPLYSSRAYTNAFDRQEGLNHLSNWRYLTGSITELKRAWNNFSVLVAYSPAGAMIAHNDVAYIIDGNGRTRFIVNNDPGPGTAATKSSIAVTLADELKSVLSP